ncbi:MAG: hypothetical protein ABI547_06045 [Betaproteobacteria bacterium]
MNLRTATICAALAASAPAAAADSSDRSSQIDRNAACMDRTVDASTGKCVVKDEGTPRRTYPPRPAAPVVNPHAGATAPASTVRGAGTGK